MSYLRVQNELKISKVGRASDYVSESRVGEIKRSELSPRFD